MSHKFDVKHNDLSGIEKRTKKIEREKEKQKIQKENEKKIRLSKQKEREKMGKGIKQII